MQLEFVQEVFEHVEDKKASEEDKTDKHGFSIGASRLFFHEYLKTVEISFNLQCINIFRSSIDMALNISSDAYNEY